VGSRVWVKTFNVLENYTVNAYACNEMVRLSNRLHVVYIIINTTNDAYVFVWIRKPLLSLSVFTGP